MDLKDKVEEWVNQAFSAKTDEEVQASKFAFNELNATLTEEEKKEAGDIMRQLMAERRERRRLKRTDIDVRQRLKDVIDIVPLSYIAKNYFNRDKSWIYQRVNGSLVNGKPCAFTDDELKIFTDALREVGSKISDAALLIN